MHATGSMYICMCVYVGMYANINYKIPCGAPESWRMRFWCSATPSITVGVQSDMCHPIYFLCKMPSILSPTSSAQNDAQNECNCQFLSESSALISTSLAQNDRYRNGSSRTQNDRYRNDHLTSRTQNDRYLNDPSWNSTRQIP